MSALGRKRQLIRHRRISANSDRSTQAAILLSALELSRVNLSFALVSAKSRHAAAGPISVIRRMLEDTGFKPLLQLSSAKNVALPGFKRLQPATCASARRPGGGVAPQNAPAPLNPPCS